MSDFEISTVPLQHTKLFCMHGHNQMWVLYVCGTKYDWYVEKCGPYEGIPQYHSCDTGQSDNVNIVAEHQEPAEVLFQLGNTSNPPVHGEYKCCYRGGLWCLCGGPWCHMWQFFIFIGNRCKHKTTDIWRCSNEDQGPVSLKVFLSQFKFDGNCVSLSPQS